uniref:Uncharacterized protein n=1 Tax=Rhizophora mucronata TaxID=61149 RepID=A0A2P2N9F7_RHIMU
MKIISRITAACLVLYSPNLLNLQAAVAIH